MIRRNWMPIARLLMAAFDYADGLKVWRKIMAANFTILNCGGVFFALVCGAGFRMPYSVEPQINPRRDLNFQEDDGIVLGRRHAEH